MLVVEGLVPGVGHQIYTSQGQPRHGQGARRLGGARRCARGPRGPGPRPRRARREHGHRRQHLPRRRAGPGHRLGGQPGRARLVQQGQRGSRHPRPARRRSRTAHARDVAAAGPRPGPRPRRPAAQHRRVGHPTHPARCRSAPRRSRECCPRWPTAGWWSPQATGSTSSWPPASRRWVEYGWPPCCSPSASSPIPRSGSSPRPRGRPGCRSCWSTSRRTRRPTRSTR